MKPKLDPIERACRAGYLKALRLDAAEKKRLAREQAKLDLAASKLAEAEGGRCTLPAVVFRDGTVKPVSLVDTVAVIECYLSSLCLDTETSGYWVGHQFYELRTVQLGGEEMAVVFDAADAKQMLIVKWALANAQKIWAHSTTADAVPLVVAGLISWDDIWSKLYDSVIRSKLVDPKLADSGADKLKELARSMLREYAVSPAAEEAKDKLFSVMKCLKKTDNTTPPERNGWHQVSKFAVTMIRYAGSDVLDLAAVLRVLPPIPVAEEIMERERETEKICARAALDGFPLDFEHIGRQIDETLAKQKYAQRKVLELTNGVIVNPSASKEVLDYLTANGYDLKLNRKTKKVSAGKDSLEPLAARGDELARNIVDYRASVTKLGLLLRPLRNLCTHGDAIMRPTVYTINATTGRMCLPVSHSLLTKAGYRAAANVKPGDMTLDAGGNWVRVLDVHRYADSPLVSVDSRGLKLSATPEHRWVTTLEHRSSASRELRTIRERPRLRLHLAPSGGFDFGYQAVQADSEDERFAALIGMLVTDGRCLDSQDGEGLRAYVYQTEKKFYRQYLRVIPENAVMYDRITNGEDHHEIRLSAKWLRPRLEAANLDSTILLKDSPRLYRWVAALPLNEVRAFFSACWLSDGVKAEKGRQRSLSCGSQNLRQVLVLAAYRLGYVTTEHVAGPSEWSNGERSYLSFREPVISTNRNKPFEDGTSDVWCVTTETGTFTAVTPDGTAYLTGNSCVRPNGQQFSREGGVRACVRAASRELELIDGQWVIAA